mmetsp:Transcript_118700/g.378475  ORF Transcript_118700/g.378475 Transcript_118700/m.378475 type:complete len:159 (-) Transcript_118700:57-533(-)
MGGSFSCSGVRDAYGGYLEEGDYVECTTTGGAKQSLGRVKYIHEDRVTFQWPLFGTYTYTDSDIRYYGVSKVMGDRDGYKFKMDQIVELLDGTEAWVSLYSPQSVTLNFSQMGEGYDAGGGSGGGGTRSYSQRDVEAYGLRIASAGFRGSRRQCTTCA